MLKVWNLSLVVGTFALTTFGTFLTRGSILSSVHAFAESVVGPMYLGFLVLILAGGFGLIALRSWRLGSEGRLDAAASRESAFLGNNVALVAVTAVVLLGTIFPLVVEAIQGRQTSVGEPYFVQTTVPVFLLLLFLMGVGPLLPWRRATWEQSRRRLAAPAAAGATVLVALAAFGMTNVGALLALGLAAFVAVANVGELARGVRTFARATGRGMAAAIPEAVRRNRRLYGGLVVHVGVAVAAVAITASSSFAQQTEVTLDRGEQTSFAGYSLTYEGRRALDQPHRRVIVADVAVSRDGQSAGSVGPSLNLYPAASDPIGTPSIRYGVFRDLYASVLAVDEDRATFRFFLNPGVMWLWVGGGIMALGGLLAAWPDRRPAARSEAPEPRPALVEAKR